MTVPAHPRVSVSAISSYRQSLADDLALWARHGIHRVGVSVAKLDAGGWDEGVRRLRAADVTVDDLIGPGPFVLDRPDRWDAARERLVRAVDTAASLGAGCVVCTTGPAGALTWEEAADALEEAMAPAIDAALARGVDLALEHTNSLRSDVGFVHTLRDAVDLARRLGTGVCMEVNACWAERGLTDTVRDAVDELRLVQVSDHGVGTLTTPDRLVPGDGDIPLPRILGDVLAAGYAGAFDLEIVGPRIDAEGYDAAVPRAVDALSRILTDLGA